MNDRLRALAGVMVTIGALAGCADDDDGTADGTPGTGAAGLDGGAVPDAGSGGIGGGSGTGEGGAGGTADAGGGPPGLDGGSASGDGGALGLTDAEIAMITKTLSEAEVEQARLALRRADDVDVRSYAIHMLKEHGGGLFGHALLLYRLQITPADSGANQRLRARGLRTVQALRETAPEDFEAAYIAAQIRAHTEALDLLRTELIPDADSMVLRYFLTQVASGVERHLEQARDVAPTLGEDD